MTTSGRVSAVQHTTRVTGGRNSTWTAYIVKFRIDGRQYSRESSKPEALADGDLVAVAGQVSGGEFIVLAMKNLTTGVATAEGTGQGIASGIVILLLGLALWHIIPFEKGKYTYLLKYVIGIGFPLAVILLWWGGSMVAAAEKELAAFLEKLGPHGKSRPQSRTER